MSQDAFNYLTMSLDSNIYARVQFLQFKERLETEIIAGVEHLNSYLSRHIHASSIETLRCQTEKLDGIFRISFEETSIELVANSGLGIFNYRLQNLPLTWRQNTADVVGGSVLLIQGGFELELQIFCVLGDVKLRHNDRWSLENQFVNFLLGKLVAPDRKDPRLDRSES